MWYRSVLPLCLCLLAAHLGTGQRDDHNQWDYIVIGSGPGGGPLASNLARAGHSVLLLEAGGDSSEVITSYVPALFPFGITDPALRWDFYVHHHDDPDRMLQSNQLVWRLTNGSLYVGNGEGAPEGAVMLGVYYPRGGTLGGSSANNAMGVVYPSESDWGDICERTGDISWSPEHMREIFNQMEHNNFLPPGTPGHGFDGWFETNQPANRYMNGTSLEVPILATCAKLLGDNPEDILELVRRDGNSICDRDQAEGVFGTVMHLDENFRRFTAGTRVLDTIAEMDDNGHPKNNLTLQLHSLATRVLFDRGNRRTPLASGVEYLLGENMYSADPQYNASSEGELRQAFARKEVIISGGVFNSPQLLMLSGVGPREHLESLGIDVVNDLPGVGQNMQDNYEFPIIGHALSNFTTVPDPDAPVCSYGFGDDPCIPLWLNHTGPYSQEEMNLPQMTLKSAHAAYGERDIMMAAGAFALRGFFPPLNYTPVPDPPNMYGIATVKIHPQNAAGTVSLRSNDARDVPYINFRHFSQGADMDLAAELHVIKWARRVFAATPAPVGPIVPVEPPCPAGPAEDGSCDDEMDRQWVLNQVFGHHATSTCAIGGDGDEMAVLDSKFRVRGVNGLRVVDASAFPRTPGPFPLLPTFMLSQKASEDILSGM